MSFASQSATDPADQTMTAEEWNYLIDTRKVVIEQVLIEYRGLEAARTKNQSLEHHFASTLKRNESS